MPLNATTKEKPKSTEWVAQILGYTPQTIMRMAREGDLPGFRVTPRGAWKFHEKEILALRETKARKRPKKAH